MSHVRLLIALVAALAAGCATDIPAPMGFAPSDQVKLRAPHHWDVVAGDIAAQLQMQLGSIASGVPVYVQPPLSRSPFELAMHEFVLTHLVEDGVRVDRNPANALHVSLGTQLITNVSDRDTVAVPLTAIVAGVMVAYNVALHANDTFRSAAALGAAAAYDIGSGRLVRPGGPSKTELIVTTSVADSGRYLARRTDVYYINDVDFSLYVEPKPVPPTPTREYQVQGER